MLINSRLSGMSRSTTALRVSGNNRGKLVVIRKIIMISSMQKQVKKLLLKLIENGRSWLSEILSNRLLCHSRTILDNEKQKQLSNDLNNIMLRQNIKQKQQQDNWFYGMVLKLIKYFIIPPIEKNYIIQIEKQLQQDQELETSIQNIQNEIQKEKKKKLHIYEMQKSGIIAVPRNISTQKQNQQFDNKLMRANQKLNEICCNNSKLRQKINQLRKQKNSMEDIYIKLKKQLENKKQNVQNTIKTAGKAYCARNQAEQDIRILKQQAEIKKQHFRTDCIKLNKQIQHDIRFKQFIKNKQVEKQQLEKLEQEIRQNQENIIIKKQANSKIQEQYLKSVQKQIEIKTSFDHIKRHVGISDSTSEQEGVQLFNIFVGLYQKNAVMKNFVQELNTEVQNLQEKIGTKKREIGQMYFKGIGDEGCTIKLNQNLKKKYDYQQKRKQILKNQYEKSIETIDMIKKYLFQIFKQINADPEVVDKLKNCNINEENLNQFLGQLERIGLEAISHYGRLVSEQLKAQKGSQSLEQQIKQLNNVVTLDNLNLTNGFQAGTKSIQYPSELLIKIKEDKWRQQDLQKPLTVQELKKFALQSLQQFQKRQIPKEKHQGKKYNMFSVISNKSKKRQINN